ncbi:MAG: AP2 domain-containing protein [Thermodesulfobacteriota bacterium]
MPKVAQYRNISRIDHNKTHGWYARVMHNGTQRSKLFSDQKNGGRGAALLCAMTWRDRIKSEMGIPVTDKHIQGKANTNTGVVGVRFNEKENKYYVSWQCPDGRPGNTSVSANKHGKKKAFAMAKAIRVEKERLRLYAA